MQPGEGAVALRQTQLATAVADRAELSKADAKRALAALDEVVLDEVGNAEKVRIGGLVQLTVRVRPAQKARTGRNPATGEEITIAKPASVQATGATSAGQTSRMRSMSTTAPLGGELPVGLSPSPEWGDPHSLVRSYAFPRLALNGSEVMDVRDKHQAGRRAWSDVPSPPAR
jgi:DNA-binding protein HU-beta